MSKEIAQRILGKTELNNLIIWYKEIVSLDSDFIVFVSKESFSLLTILEKITNIELNDNIYTDLSIMLYCDKLAEFYRQNKRFPSIYLCDNILIHGRNFNRIISELENQLFELLNGEEEKQVIRDKLAEELKIKVYCYAKDSTLRLRNRYRKNTKYNVKYSSVKMRELEGNISSLIAELGISNLEIISNESFDSYLDKYTFQNIDGYTKVCLLKNDYNEVYAICTLLVVNNRVKPFIFMPNLDENKTKVLFDSIRNKGLDLGYEQELFDNIWSLSKLKGKRAFNEWITLILSQAILNDLNIRLIDIDSLVINYKIPFYDSNELRNILRKLLIEKPIFLSIRELDNVLKKSNRKIFTIGTKERQTIESINQYFYEKGYANELEVSKNTFDSNLQEDISRNIVRGSCFVLKELLEGLSIESVSKIISQLLCLMELNIFSVSSVVSKDINVVGYAQFLKIENQALFLEPIKYMEYIPFLSIASEWSEKLRNNLEEHLKRYYKSDYCDIKDNLRKELLVFVERLREICQKVSDWNINYYEKMGIEREEQRILERKRLEHIEHYEEFLRDYMKN